MTREVLTTGEVEAILDCPRGRAMRMVRDGAIPYVVLPDGQIRFLRDDLFSWLRSLRKTPITTEKAVPQ